MKKTGKILAVLVGIVILVVLILKTSEVSFRNINDSLSCYFLDETSILLRVKNVDDNIKDFKIIEKVIYGIPSEGTNVKFYYDKNISDLILVEVNSFASVARYFSRYYFKNNNVYFIDSVTDEWDLQKLHGKSGELSSSEGEYVIGTSTREQYLISNEKLCKYIAKKPRVKSAAVTGSDPAKDAKGLLEMLQFIMDNK